MIEFLNFCLETIKLAFHALYVLTYNRQAWQSTEYPLAIIEKIWLRLIIFKINYLNIYVYTKHMLCMCINILYPPPPRGKILDTPLSFLHTILIVFGFYKDTILMVCRLYIDGWPSHFLTSHSFFVRPYVLIYHIWYL